MATGRVPTTANSPLTAKGDLFGYSTTQARVAVGNDGETLVADSSATTGLSYQANWAAGKNKIINGDFRINQRAFTSITADGTYGFDRWALGTAGGATYTPQTFTAGAAPVAGYEAINFAQVATTGQTATGTITILLQRIEDVRTVAGQTVTISFWAKADSGTPSVAIELQQNFGSGGSSTVNTYAGKITTSTSWARYSVSVAVPSVSGKTIGAGSFIALQLWTSAGSDFNARTGTLGIQTATIGFWGVQVEAGSVATAFQTATGTIQGELAACQRYYWRTSNSGVTNANLGGTGFTYATTAGAYWVNNPVAMRTKATSVDAANLRVYDITGAAAYTATATISTDSTTINTVIDFAVTGATANRVVRLDANTTGGYLGFSAEL